MSTECPWQMPDGGVCGEPRESSPNAAYCTAHRREYQRTRYAQKVRGEFEPGSGSAAETASCYCCDRKLSQGIRRSQVQGRVWCNRCADIRETLAAMTELTHQRMTEAVILVRKQNSLYTSEELEAMAAWNQK